MIWLLILLAQAFAWCKADRARFYESNVERDQWGRAVAIYAVGYVYDMPGSEPCWFVKFKEALSK